MRDDVCRRQPVTVPSHNHFLLSNDTSVARVRDLGAWFAQQRSIAPAFVLTRGRHFGTHEASSIDPCTETLLAGRQLKTESCVLAHPLLRPSRPFRLWASQTRNDIRATVRRTKLWPRQ